MSCQDDILKRCYDRHPFEELNNIDYSMLYGVMTAFFQKFPDSKTGVFFDVGCNAGSFVKVLNSLVAGGSIHCFEPHPVLSKHVLELYPKIKMNEYCIGNMNGHIDIHIPIHSVGLSSVIRRPVFEQLNQEIVTLNVKCQTLDSYCVENSISSIDFIKIDVEGAEKLVFDGSKNMLSNKKIKAGIFEVGSTLTDAGTSADEICSILQGYGYNIVKTLSPNDYYFHI